MASTEYINIYYNMGFRNIFNSSSRHAPMASIFLFLIGAIAGGCASVWTSQRLMDTGAVYGNVHSAWIYALGSPGRKFSQYNEKILRFATYGDDNKKMDSMDITIMGRIPDYKSKWHGDNEVEIEVHSLTYSEQADLVEKTIDDSIVGTWTIQIDPQNGHILHSQWVPSKTAK